MTRAAALLLPLALLLAIAGCPGGDTEHRIGIYQTSAAPPGRTAEIEDDDLDDVHTIRLSSGVALAFDCWTSCEYTCVNPSFVADASGIVEVRDLWAQWGDAWMIYGAAPGTTRLTVKDACAEQVYDVAVLDD